MTHRMIFAAAVSAALMGVAGQASAQDVASVSVAIGAPLQKKADTYGERELAYLARSLQAEVETALARQDRISPAGGRLELVLDDAAPNRPTFEQLADKPGLSLQSFGVGGAAIKGHLIAPDGTRTPVGYRWFETDIRQAYGRATWTDAQTAFSRFARRLSTDDRGD